MDKETASHNNISSFDVHIKKWYSSKNRKLFIDQLHSKLLPQNSCNVQHMHANKTLLRKKSQLNVNL